MKTCPKCGASYDEALKFCETDGEVLEDSPDSLVGRTLDGQYAIEAFVARGGMGTIYRARHILLGDRVAVKLLRPEMQSNSSWLRRFQREGQAARRFRHPNSVTVYDLRTSPDGTIYMVMEYVEGITLDDELERRERLAPPEALEVLEPIARVLDAAHAQGVIHRDLKPDNVMLARDGDGELRVKLLDLGIAKLLDATEATSLEGDRGSPLTVVGQILGTPYYMSPEQWGEPQRDGNPEVDARTDVYSLAVIFYEAVAGRRPFSGRSLAELRHAHAATYPPPLDELNPEVPAEFARAVERGMAKERDDRFQTAGEFVSALRAALGMELADAHASTFARETNGQGRTRGGARSQTLPSENRITSSSDATPTALLTETEEHKVRPLAGVSTDSPPRVVGRLGDESVTAAAPPRTGQSISPTSTMATQERRTSASVVALTAVALVLACGAVVAGWLVWQRAQSRRAAPQDNPAVVGPETPKTATPAPVEALSYWIEAFAGARAREGERVARAGSISLASGQQFKFHFSPAERGYFYIIGPGQGNAPTTFLTAQPLGIMKTNQAAAGSDFTFPYGSGQVIQLDKNPGTEEYTIIFSTTPLLTPRFLAERAGRELSPAELKELEDLRARAKTAAPGLDVKDAGGGLKSVSVSTPPPAEGSPQLVVFDVRIEHR